MKPILLIDFGSTYTKLTAVDVEGPTLLGSAAAYTTVETDINTGLNKALDQMEQKIGIRDFDEVFAASSAAGGLRMVAVGLVPDLTEKAARLACFGAGAKVIKSYSYGLTEEDILEIDQIKPDILLLAGGTDGGNQKNIIHDATLLANCKETFPIIYAGNRNAAKEAMEHLSQKEVKLCANLMPKFNVLNVEPVQEEIRDIFLKQIVSAKGLQKASEFASGHIIPTPSAMLIAMELLAVGTEKNTGIGELLAVDLGGATTDIYSIAKGMPKKDDVIFKGVPEPFAKRTVEGDIGMRYSSLGIVDAVGYEKLANLSQLEETKVQELVEFISTHTEKIPDTPELERLDEALASGAVETAVNRHVGTMEQVYTPLGMVYAQNGKDLRDVKNIVLTGGALIHQKDLTMVKSAVTLKATDNTLKPKSANIYQDKNYILSAMGLLSERYPEEALTLMKKELNTYDIPE